MPEQSLIKRDTRCQVFIAVVVAVIFIFRVLTPRDVLCLFPHFGKTYCLLLQGD